MTGQTKKIIDQYKLNKDVHLFPTIVLSLQEEDNVANVIQFKNCFRQLRNLAAHEPDTLVSQIMDKYNKGSSKLVFVSKQDDGNNRVVLDMVQFTVWMFDMYVKTSETYYMDFWQATMDILYPCKKEKELEKSLLCVSNHNDDMLTWFLRWQTILWEKKGVPKLIAQRDPYVINMYSTNVKVFWRMALPNMMDMVMMMVCNEINPRDISNVNGFIRIFKEKEGTC